MPVSNDIRDFIANRATEAIGRAPATYVLDSELVWHSPRLLAYAQFQLVMLSQHPTCTENCPTMRGLAVIWSGHEEYNAVDWVPGF